MMFTQESAEYFAKKLESDWNTKNLDLVLNYFTDDVELISTNIQRFISESNGVINGKETLRNYWEFTLDKFSYFEYKLHEINFEENKLILKFFNSLQDSFSVGVLSFNEEMKVYKMVTTYV